jgi:predicted DNA-binding helix-hairpin-helix protein
MGTVEKLEVLARAAQYDLACACGGQQARTHGPEGRWVYPVALPDGGTLPVLKVLQSAGCERNCMYCAERSGGRHRAAGFTPDELARTFMGMVRAGVVNGLFLSSAIRGTPVATMDRMLGTLERLRFRHGFFGFVHIKVIPGAEESQILRAMQLANRVSVNLEAPTEGHLASIAPGKQYRHQLGDAMRFIAKHLGRRDLRCRSHTTQYVVGAADEQDREILRSLWNSYRRLRLGRGYFSAFQPILGTPLGHRPPTPAMREHRLYQADFLFRKYRFSFDDIIFDDAENLSLTTDPKTLWATRHPEFFPIEINRAAETALLRVPGIGPTAAAHIIAARRESRLTDLDGLKAVTRRWRIAAPYLLFDGRRRSEAGHQLVLPI